MQETVQEHKHKLSLPMWLQGLEQDIIKLQCQYPNHLPPLTESQSMARHKEDNNNNAPPQENQVTQVSVADRYFQHVITTLREIIIEITPIISAPLSNRTAIMNLIQDPEDLLAEVLRTKCLDIGTFGLPHIFHPVLNEETNTMVFEGDQRCFELALITQKHLNILHKADLGIVINLIKDMIPDAKNGIHFLLSIINGRIERYQFNQRYRSILHTYLYVDTSTLNETIASFTEDEWSASQLSLVLGLLTDITENAYKHQAVIPRFLRDNPLSRFNRGGFRQFDQYPKLLRAFMDNNNDLTRALELYRRSPSMDNVLMGFEIEANLKTIIQILKEKHAETLESCPDQYLKLVHKLDILHIRNLHLHSVQNLVEREAPKWSSRICNALEKLLTGLKPYSEYNPDGRHFQITNHQKQFHQLSKLSRHLYHDLRNLMGLTGDKNDDKIKGHANVYLFNDLLTQTIKLVRRVKKDFETSNQTNTPIYEAIKEFLTSTQDLQEKLSDLAAHLQAAGQEAPLHQNSNN